VISCERETRLGVLDCRLRRRADERRAMIAMGEVSRVCADTVVTVGCARLAIIARGGKWLEKMDVRACGRRREALTFQNIGVNRSTGCSRPCLTALGRPNNLQSLWTTCHSKHAIT